MMIENYQITFEYESNSVSTESCRYKKKVNFMHWWKTIIAFHKKIYIQEKISPKNFQFFIKDYSYGKVVLLSWFHSNCYSHGKRFLYLQITITRDFVFYWTRVRLYLDIQYKKRPLTSLTLFIAKQLD